MRAAAQLPQNAAHPLPATGYVRMAQLIPSVVPVSPATFWRYVKNGTFPAPVKLSARVTAWKVEDVRAWLDNPTAESGALK